MRHAVPVVEGAYKVGEGRARMETTDERSLTADRSILRQRYPRRRCDQILP